MGASVCVCTQCGLHVCQAHGWAVQKWLSRSRCHLVGTLTWAQSTCTWWGAHWCHLVCMTHQSKHDSDAPSLMSYYFDLFSVIALVHTLVYDTGWSALRRRYFDFWNAVDGVQEPHSQCSLQHHTTNISAERKVKLLFQNAFTSELFAPGYEGKPITDNSLATLVQHDIHKSLIAKLFPVITHSSINHSIIGGPAMQVYITTAAHHLLTLWTARSTRSAVLALSTRLCFTENQDWAIERVVVTVLGEDRRKRLTTHLFLCDKIGNSRHVKTQSVSSNNGRWRTALGNLCQNPHGATDKKTSGSRQLKKIIKLLSQDITCYTKWAMSFG